MKVFSVLREINAVNSRYEIFSYFLESCTKSGNKRPIVTMIETNGNG